MRQAVVLVLLLLAAAGLAGCTAVPLLEVLPPGTPPPTRLHIVDYSLNPSLPAATSGALNASGTPTMAASVTATAVPTVTTAPTKTPTPTQTATPTATATPTETPTPTLTPSPTAVPASVNGVPLNEIALLDEAVRQRIRETAALGRELGRDPRALSKIGDSVALTPHYLTLFDRGSYDLGEEYAYLQPTIDHFGGSWERYGVATRIGLHAWSLFDPFWADKEWCLPAEDMVACEVRLHNPAVLLVRLGSNDAGAPAYFEENMRLLVDYALANGIVPIMSTKADRFEGADNRNNLIIREIAGDYDLPLWDFDRAAETLPNKGLGSDQVHMTMSSSNDYTDPANFQRGYPVSDLTALMTIHEVLREMTAVP